MIGRRVDDFLVGGNGLDTLIGGAGRDRFIFQNIRHGADRIADFNEGQDQILLRQAGFSLDLPKGALASARFTIGSAAQDGRDRVIYNDQTGVLSFDSDGLGGREGRAIAFMSRGLDLNATDIRII